jgi:hypothetical protein
VGGQNQTPTRTPSRGSLLEPADPPCVCQRQCRATSMHARRQNAQHARRASAASRSGRFALRTLPTHSYAGSGGLPLGVASVRTWGGHIPGVALRQQLIEVVQVHKVVELPVCNKTVSAQLRNRPSPFAPSPSLRFVSLTPCLSLSRELSLSRSSSSLSLSLSLSLVLSLSRCASARAHTHTLALSRQASLSVSLALARVSTIVRVAYFGRQ